MHTVMVVDDEDVIVTGLVRTMPWQKYDCEVIATASNGIAAMDLIRAKQPEILFTDICMPGADGLAVIAAVRSEFPAMQVTILSGYPNFEYAQRAIGLGVVRYILKPSKFAELESALAVMTANLGGELAAEPAAEEASGTEKAQNFIIQNAIAYLETHYDEKLTLSDVAEHVYVSQWHLSKLIAHHTDQSFSDLLGGIRIEKAKELLADPALKIWEISEKTGFADVTHFSRIFKKLTGMSANEYRNSGAVHP
ncbi:MAG: response regulator [Ruthenibacterium sp.]